MSKKIIFFLLLTFLINLPKCSFANVYIVTKVNNEIVTNADISKEVRYLKILNPNLLQLNDDKLLILAKNSLINEIVKKKEIEKIFNIDEENPQVENYLKDLYLKLNYVNEEEFKNDLKENDDYSFEQLKQKIKIELLWNQLIYSKYINQVNIDQKKLLKKIYLLKNKNNKEYDISEIVFKKDKNKSLEQVIEQIKLSIEEIGFNNTATIFSLAESSKFGGKIGWINESSLAKQIADNIIKLDIGEHSEVIKINNNYLIIKIDEIRTSQVEIDQEKELEKLINFERNKQLNQFSRIYFDKSKINYSINEK